MTRDHIRTAEHYRRMFRAHHGSVGLSLAARAVYVAKYGGDPDDDRERYREIFFDLKRCYGDTLSAPEALREMTAPRKSPAAVALGARGGKAGTGAAKARTHKQAQAAARARWDKGGTGGEAKQK
jgi:hypothetical protein